MTSPSSVQALDYCSALPEKKTSSTMTSADFSW